MSHVSVTINGRLYRMACDDGQEDHLVKLAEDLDRRIGQLRTAFGEIGDMRLTVMASLTVGDELVETRKRLKGLEAQLEDVESAKGAVADRADHTRHAVASALDSAAERIERLSRLLNGGPTDETLHG